MARNYLATGQRRCWDATGRVVSCVGSGQDAEFRAGLPWPAQRFRVAGGEVIDQATGLVWLKLGNRPGGPLFWSEALDYVAAMNRERVHERDDWRLPSRRELLSLVSFETAVPALPAGHPFVGAEPTWYWSATSSAVDPAMAWGLELLGGRMFFFEKVRSALVWPCRGRSAVVPATGQRGAFGDDGGPLPLAGSGQDGDGAFGVAWPTPRFEVRGATVCDRLTDLVWLREADAAAGPTSWEGALAVVRRLDRRGVGDRSDWRLPTIAELESLVDASTCRPALPNGHPFASLGDSYWSSTSSAYQPDWAMVLHIDRGAVGVGPKAAGRAFRVWPVAGR